VQFDAGKLQTLATLLRDLKQGGHRVLIFTQMSKMLDVLEAFLNLNGHTYLRLDGATDVDRRQRLMDRFNNDPKVFCFILSTRSGGLGINLTGADTVVFYDSDWNPAMDAQAQDRYDWNQIHPLFSFLVVISSLFIRRLTTELIVLVRRGKYTFIA
jgi:SNF2 family DNA or RNA helicase